MLVRSIVRDDCESSHGRARRVPTERRMLASMVVVVDPGADLLARVVEAKEQRFSQEFVAHAPVEALAEADLRRLARRDVSPLDFAVAGKGEDDVRGELRAVVGDDHAGIAAPPDQRRQLPDNALARDRRVGDRRQTQSLSICRMRGWGGRIRTSVWRNQNPLPYRLATPQRARRRDSAPPADNQLVRRCGDDAAKTLAHIVLRRDLALLHGEQRVDPSVGRVPFPKAGLSL